ncbi:MAG: amino acid adenylation domain-containing protein [Candidatus Aminicenantes bacterium]|nr:MAG: amino acid adenylation domain-containing protein [Candidatus Aminicenantes bacterium]
MAGRFPGAKNIDQLWENLKNGVESAAFLTDRELEEAGVSAELLKNLNYVKTGEGLLEEKEYFDASFFDYTPQEAEVLNPQARIFLEISWEALENAAYNPFTGDQLIGVYAGADSSFYWEALSLLSGKNAILGDFAASLLADENNLCTRVSYTLNLKGPGVAVQSACSTSLVAIHMAGQALLNGECDLALAGGVNIFTQKPRGYLYQEGMINSPDGHCRAFDAKAKGMIRGEGGGAVVLKPLENAIEDRDYIHAVIKGSAINNDGLRKVGYTAPSVKGQADVIQITHQFAGIEPESITYVEAHGTGTSLGDPIEIKALKRAFKTDKKKYCAVGSVKTNVGHLGSAAGAAGFIKTVMALKHKLIPPSLHFENPNPEIDLENSPFYVNTQPVEWNNHGYPLRAGVSSFGIGGTNAHVVLEEAPEGTGGLAPLPGERASRKYQLILLSAKTETALEKMTKNLAAYFKKSLLNHGSHENPVNPGLTLADAAYTLQVGRKELQYRRMLVCSTVDEAVEELLSPASRKVHTFFSKKKAKPVVFMFPGLGAQYVNMGRGLYRDELLFRKEMDSCFEILKSLLDYDIKEILYPDNLVSEVSGAGSYGSAQTPDTTDSPLERGTPDPRKGGGVFNINQIEIAQPVLFIFEYALSKLLMSWGITPHAMIGYSFGEYTAAAIAGVFSLEDALKLIVTRGELIKKIPGGGMLSVPLLAEELSPVLAGDLSLAIDNGPSCIVSGPLPAIAAFEKEMKNRRFLTMRLQASHALHSHMMEPILSEYEKSLDRVTLNHPEIPYISNVTGTFITPGEALDPRYWARHLRQTVRFAGGIKELIKEPNAIFLEIGPGQDLAALVARYMENGNHPPHQKIINFVRPFAKEIPDTYYLMNKIGRLWLAGVTVNWFDFYCQEKRSRIPLPTYPFERQRYWLEEDLLTGGPGLLKGNAVSAQSPDLADWFYLPSWKQAEAAVPHDKDTYKKKHKWLVFIDTCGLGSLLVEGLKKQGHQVVRVTTGSAFAQLDQDRYTINPLQAGDYLRLFNACGSGENIPHQVVHLWSLTGPPTTVLSETAAKDTKDTNYFEASSFEQVQHLGFYSLLNIAKAIGKQGTARQILLNVICDHLHDITGEEPIHPGKATLMGPVKVIPQEYPNIRCRTIDIILPGFNPGNLHLEILAARLLAEMAGDGEIPDTLVAFRGQHRWIRTFEPLPLHPEEAEGNPLPLKQGGVYLITGGLGNIGLMLAEYLAKAVKARLVLVGRSPLQPGEQQEKIEQLKESGAEVLTFQGDVADEKQVQAIITEVEHRFGRIHGVIHAAGVTSGNSFELIDKIKPPDCREQFGPKVYGTLVLEKLFRDKDLDFCWLISSISAVLGGLTFVAYSAANAFMDAFAAHRAWYHPGRRPWLSVNWDGMEPGNTKKAFQRFLYLRDIHQLAVSTGGNLQARIDKWIKLKALENEENKTRPHLMSPYVAPQNPVEKSIAEIFQTMFGYEQIGIEDDFFELGLDSIKAIQIRARMIKKGYWVELEDFFRYPTISKLAPTARKTEPGKEPQKPEVKEIPIETLEQLKAQYPVQDIYPLTPMQEGMLFYSLYETGNTQAYFEQVGYCLQGELDVVLVEKSVNELIKRHDILRTAFAHKSLERPLQVVLKERKVDFHYKDLRPVLDGKDKKKETFTREYMEKDRQRSFELSKDALIRLAVLQTGDAEYVFIWSYHHMLMDGWCIGILTSDYFEIYNSLLRGEEYQLPPVRPFREYIQWLERQDKNKARSFWKKYLDGYEEIAALPKKKNIETKALTLEEEFLAGGIGTTLERDKTMGLQEMAVRNRVTLNTIFQSIWAIVLAKYSDKPGADVVFGAVVSGRPSTLEGVETMVGCFINTIPVRIRFDYQTTFKQLLGNVQQNAIQSEPYHYFSLAEIQSLSPLKQNLLDHFLEFQNYPIAKQIEDVGDRVRKHHPAETMNLSHVQVFEQGNYDFVFDIIPVEGEQLSLDFGYNANVYDTNLMTGLGLHYLQVVDQIIRDEEIIIGKITLLSEKEKRQILFEFNRKENFSRDKTLCQLVEEQAHLDPDAAAVVFRDNWLTYNRLNEHANQVAMILKTSGIQKDQAVGILMERSPLMADCIHGVWKAGGAYIPLDSQEPTNRIIGILEDSAAKVLLTREQYLDSTLEQAYHGKIIPLEMEVETREMLTNPKPGPEMNGLAYIIYTSGSTGKPKGAMIEHTGMMNHIQAKINDLQLNSNSIIAQNASHTFDISVWQFFTALTLGGRTVIYPDNVILEPHGFISRVKNDGVTVLEVVPSYLSTMLETVPPSALLSLKYLLVTGEEIKPHLVKKWFERFPAVKMVNAYGPTEASDDITHYIMDNAPGMERVPIGQPLQNLFITIVDNFMQLCPIGVKGEICVSGIGVGRGYLNNPELTAEKFLNGPRSTRINTKKPNKKFLRGGPGAPRRGEPKIAKCFAPYAMRYAPCAMLSPPGRRRQKIYKTGDIGRWLPDGNIEFFGRKDYQVKIRGYRIEPGEIENRLNRHEKIKQAVVINNEDKPGNINLTAYLVMNANNPMDILEIKEYLQESLPGYMIPSYIEQLEKIPLTSNGKVDRQALPSPGKKVENKLTPPRNEIESSILDVWSEVLKIDKRAIGVHSDFFELGGHSLKAVSVVSMLAKDFDIDINRFFKYPTIAELAPHIRFNKNKMKNQLNVIIEQLKKLPDPAALTKPAKNPLENQLKNEYRQYKQRVQKEKDINLKKRRNYRHILLTGSTGFLGAHLLYELLNQKNREPVIYLLVRTTTGKTSEAEKRLQEILVFYFGTGFYHRYKERLKVLAGDLTLDRFGLDSQTYKKLAAAPDVIIHAAANVKHFGLYEDIYDSNVRSTERLLEFALDTKVKDFIHISTMGVCTGATENKEFHLYTEYQPDCGQLLRDHYLKSKLEAEKKVLFYRTRGLNALIFRVGTVVFHSETGKFQKNISTNALYSQLASMVKFGIVPRVVLSQTFDFGFVDYIAKAIILLHDREILKNQVYHLYNRHLLSLDKLIFLMGKNGKKIKRVSLDKFCRFLYDNLYNPEIRNEMDMFLLYTGFLGGFAGESDGNDGSGNTVFGIVSDRTGFFLGKLGFRWPRVNEKHIKKMLKHCKEVNFL